MITLTAHKRTKTGSRANAVLRASGALPGIVYGPKDSTVAITLSRLDFEKVWREAGESSVISLSIDGEEKEVLIHDVAFDAVKNTPIHIDLYAIEKGKKVTVSVPLSFTGVSLAEKEMGGMLLKVLHEVEVEAIPKDLPHDIAVDISAITNLDTPFLAKQLALPSGVTLVTSADEVVAVVAPTKEYVEEVAAPVDMSTIEVAERGKKEEADAETS